MSRIFLTLFGLLLAAVPPASTAAESGADVIDRMIEAEAGSYAGIENLYQVSRIMGHRVPEYYEMHGGYLRQVPVGELLERQQETAISQATPEQLTMAADSLRAYSGRVDAAIRDEIAESGVAQGAMGNIIRMASNPPEEWLTSSPGGMMNLYATMLDAARDAREANDEQKSSDLAENIANDQLIEQVKSETRIIGHTNLDGYDVIEIGADDLELRQQSDDGEFVIESLRILVDETNHFARQFRIEGTLRQGKESRAMTIERTDSNFAGGDNCGDLMRPRQSVMRLAGALDPQQQAELDAARAQLAALPPEQQAMMKQMMGKQFEMIENMAASGGIEIVTDVLELRCNAGPPDAEELASDTRL